MSRVPNTRTVLTRQIIRPVSLLIQNSRYKLIEQHVVRDGTQAFVSLPDLCKRAADLGGHILSSGVINFECDIVTWRRLFSSKKLLKKLRKYIPLLRNTLLCMSLSVHWTNICV
jgi:hypothetical protein